MLYLYGHHWSQHLQWESHVVSPCFLHQTLTSCFCDVVFRSSGHGRPCCVRDAATGCRDLSFCLLTSRSCLLSVPLAFSPLAFHVGFLSAEINPLSFSASQPFPVRCGGQLPPSEQPHSETEKLRVWLCMCARSCVYSHVWSGWRPEGRLGILISCSLPQPLKQGRSVNLELVDLPV